MEKIYIYGINACNEAIKNSNRKIYKFLIAKENSSRISNIIEEAKKLRIPYEFLNNKTLNNLVQNANHQGIIAEVSPLKKYDIYEALEQEKDLKKTKWLAIDSITDPINLGSLIRSAVCLGFTALILPEKRTVQVTSTVEKISAGAVEKIKIIEVVNLNRTILELKEKNFWVYGADKAGKDISKYDFTFPLLLIIGSEGEGLHQKTKEHCDEVIAIPQIENFDSLNAAISGAIIMYEIGKKNI